MYKEVSTHASGRGRDPRRDAQQAGPGLSALSLMACLLLPRRYAPLPPG